MLSKFSLLFLSSLPGCMSVFLLLWSHDRNSVCWLLCETDLHPLPMKSAGMSWLLVTSIHLTIAVVHNTSLMFLLYSVGVSSYSGYIGNPLRPEKFNLVDAHTKKQTLTL